MTRTCDPAGNGDDEHNWACEWMCRGAAYTGGVCEIEMNEAEEVQTKR